MSNAETGEILSTFTVLPHTENLEATTTTDTSPPWHQAAEPASSEFESHLRRENNEIFQQMVNRITE